MCRSLFCQILFSVRNVAICVPSLSSLQKVIVAYRILIYGVHVDFLDDHVRIGESTTIESLRHFEKAVVAIFSERY